MYFNIYFYFREHSNKFPLLLRKILYEKGTGQFTDTRKTSLCVSFVYKEDFLHVLLLHLWRSVGRLDGGVSESRDISVRVPIKGFLLERRK